MEVNNIGSAHFILQVEAEVAVPPTVQLLQHTANLWSLGRKGRPPPRRLFRVHQGIRALPLPAAVSGAPCLSRCSRWCVSSQRKGKSGMEVAAEHPALHQANGGSPPRYHPRLPRSAGSLPRRTQRATTAPQPLTDRDFPASRPLPPPPLAMTGTAARQHPAPGPRPGEHRKDQRRV